MIRGLVLVGVCFFACAALFLWSGFGRRTITRSLQGFVAHNVTMTTLEGWFPFDFTVASLVVPDVLNLHDVHVRHNVLSHLYHPSDTLMDDVVISHATLFGIDLPACHVQRVAFHNHERWTVSIGDLTITSHVHPWTNTTFESHGETIVLTPTYLFLDKKYPYTLKGNRLFVADDRPPSTLAPIRTVTWSSDGVVVDVGSSPMYINKRGIQHGPARAWYAQPSVFVELSSIQYKTFECLNVTAKASNVQVAELTHISARTIHGDTIQGTGTYHFGTKELDLNVQITF